jgi:hypothetical protein
MTLQERELFSRRFPADGDGARLVVRGRPKGSFLTTRIGEDIHAREVEKDLVGGIEQHLPATP